MRAELTPKQLDENLKTLCLESGGHFIDAPVGLTTNSQGKRTGYTVGIIASTSLNKIFDQCKALSHKQSRRKLLYLTRFGVSPKLKNGEYSVRVAVV